MGFLPWEIRVALPGESQQQQSRATLAGVHAGCFSVSLIHRTLTWTTRSLTCECDLFACVVHLGPRFLVLFEGLCGSQSLHKI